MSQPSTAAPVAKHATLGLALVAVLAAVQGSDPNIASVALAEAVRGLDITNRSLAASISTLALAGTAITTGLLADALGRRRVLQVALVVSIVGDLMVFAAPDATFYLLGRAIAGIGLGAVYGAGFAYVRALAPPGKLAATMGLWTAMLMVATLLLTFIGGGLSQIEWRTAYLVIPITCAVCFFLVPFLLPKEPRIKPPSFDVLGQVLLGLGVIALLVGISDLGKSLTNPIAWGGIVIGLVLLAGWFIWQSRNPNHFFPVSLFKNPVFLAAITAGFIYNFGNSIVFLQAANLWQYVNGLKTLEVSLWQLPFLISGMLAGLIVGRRMSKGLSAGIVILMGAVISAVGVVLLGLFHGGTSLWAFIPGLVLSGAGFVVASVPYGALILKEAPAKFFGPVASSRLTFGQFFYALGMAASTIVIDKLTAGGTVSRLEAAGVPPTQVGTALDAVTAYAAQSTNPTTSQGKEALADAVQSYGTGFAVAMYALAVLLLAAGVVGFLLLKRAGAAGEDTPESVKHPHPSTSQG